jgi:hypothetical protein
MDGRKVVVRWAIKSLFWKLLAAHIMTPSPPPLMTIKIMKKKMTTTPLTSFFGGPSLLPSLGCFPNNKKSQKKLMIFKLQK